MFHGLRYYALTNLSKPLDKNIIDNGSETRHSNINVNFLLFLQTHNKHYNPCDVWERQAGLAATQKHDEAWEATGD